MAVTFRAKESQADGTPPLSLTKPTGVLVNDLLILQVSCADDVVPTVPSGFVLIATAEITGTNNIRLYAKRATEEEPSAYTIGYTGSGSAGMIALFSSTHYLSVDQVAVQTNPSGDRLWPGVTATAAGMLLNFAALGLNASSTPPGGSTEQWDVSGSPRTYLMTEPLAGAGATGTRTATGTAATSKCITTNVIEGLTKVADPSAPAAVAVGPSRIQVSWTDNSGDESGFIVQQSPDGTSNWEDAADVAASPAVITGLTPETTYYFRVKAYRD